MREIKFRGKRIDNGEWVYGCLTRYSDHMSYIVVDVTENNGTYQVLTETVGQYTGLKDRNGKEIFEGDIILNLGTLERYVVEWDEVGGMFLFHHISDRHRVNGIDFYEFHDLCGVEIVGNIWDHPHLLEEATAQ